MTSIGKNLHLSQGFRQPQVLNPVKTENKQNIEVYSANIEIVQLSLQVRTGTKEQLTSQNALFHFNRLSHEDKELLAFEGTPISELSADEAAELIGADGFFGIAKTSQRIIDFVIQGAGGDVERLKAGREGVLDGFAQAEKAWGGKLPDISHETLAKSLEAIDEKIHELGGSVVDLST